MLDCYGGFYIVRKLGNETADLVGPTKYGGSGNSAEEHGGNYGREIFFAGRVL